VKSLRTHEPAGPLGLEIGIQLYTINEAMLADAPGALRRLSEIGFKEVEPAGFGSISSAKEFRKELDALGIKCPSAHLQFDVRDLGKTFDEANELGCTYVTTAVPRMLSWPPVDKVYDLPPDQLTALIQKALAPMSMDEFKRTAEVLNVVGEAAAKRGLRLAAHNHMMELATLEDSTGLDFLIEHTQPEWVSFQLDCGWTFIMGHDPVGYVERHPGRIRTLHVKDFMRHESPEPPSFFSVKGTELGRGIMDYPNIFSRLRNEGIEHIFVEQDGPFEKMSAMESASEDFRYLQALKIQ
jgi:sugar phosphate isomerase/epimerase